VVHAKEAPGVTPRGGRDSSVPDVYMWGHKKAPAEWIRPVENTCTR